MKLDDSSLPALLAAARHRFGEWRSTRTQPCRIPPALWRVAVRCAAKYGVYRTVRALGLDYKCLKGRLEAARGAPVVARSAARFVELALPARSGPPECTVEIENRQGAKLRLELRGSAVPDLVALARRFAAEGA